MVVIVILAVLVAIAIPVVQRGRASARTAECVSNVRQLGGAILSHAMDNHAKLIDLQPGVNPDTGKRPPIWTVELAWEGFLWDGKGELPCSTGVWACPDCKPESLTHGGYGVVEDSVFVYEENKPFGVNQTGSLRLHQIARPSRTWLVGDAAPDNNNLEKSWYAIWSQPDRWNSHGPAERHRGKANVCLVDGSVVSLSISEIESRGLTEDVVR